MTVLKEMNDACTLAQQMQTNEDGSVVLINLFTVEPGEEAALIEAWSDDASFMRNQPGYISTQLHQGIAGSPTFLNYAVWESVKSFHNAFSNPEFQAKLGHYPDSAVASPHLFKKLAVPGICVD